ncbi:hypothetical protein MaudCBS49596_007799 [Microsporum audouinii]
MAILSSLKKAFPAKDKFRRRSVLHAVYRLAAYSTSNNAPVDVDQEESFFQFTRGRFVCNEAEQQRQRHVKFNVGELATTAAKAIGATRCVKAQKCPDGLYNKAFLLTMDNGKEVIGKVPNPNAGPAHLTTASEVATMDFARNVLQTPVPQVYAWNSRVNEANRVGAEYIIMEKLPGIPLGAKWGSFDPPDKLKVFLQIFKYQKRWTAVKFSQFGSLYYSGDLAGRPLPGNSLYIDGNNQPVKDSRFAVGPTVGRDWLHDRKENLQCDKGPWNSLLEYYLAIGNREEIAVRTLKHVPKQCIMFQGPGAYQPTPKKKLTALESYAQILKHILPREACLAAGCLWHNDLHYENIFIDPDKPTKVVGIIDWQSTQIAPLIDHFLDPSFLGYEGPDVGDDLQRPTLRDDINSLDQNKRAAAIKDFYNTCVMVGWRMLVRANNPDQYAAIRFQQSKAGEILGLSKNLFILGEAHFRALVLDLKNEWAELGKEFPLKVSKAEIEEIEADVEAADLGIEVMNGIVERMGDLWPDKGLIEHENYEAAMAMLRDIKRELMELVVHSAADRKAFETFWPFDC